MDRTEAIGAAMEMDRVVLTVHRANGPARSMYEGTSEESKIEEG